VEHRQASGPSAMAKGGRGRCSCPEVAPGVPFWLEGQGRAEEERTQGGRERVGVREEEGEDGGGGGERGGAMPELPEVESLRLALNEHFAGRRILRAQAFQDDTS